MNFQLFWLKSICHANELVKLSIKHMNFQYISLTYIQDTLLHISAHLIIQY